MGIYQPWYFSQFQLLQSWTKRLAGFEISRYSAAKGEKLAPTCLSAIFGKIVEKSRNPVQAFRSKAVHAERWKYKRLFCDSLEDDNLPITAIRNGMADVSVVRWSVGEGGNASNRHHRNRCSSSSSSHLPVPFFVNIAFTWVVFQVMTLCKTLFFP